MENILYQSQASHKLATMIIVAGILACAFGVVVIASPFLAGYAFGPVWVFIIIGSIFFVIPLLTTAYYLLFLRRLQYKITTKGVYSCGGIFVKTEKFVPIRQITDVTVSQNILFQFLNIKSIEFQTAGRGGSSLPEITFHGVDEEEGPRQLVLDMIEKTAR